MTTKTSKYDIRRREHGELLEAAVLKELEHERIIEPILEWRGLVRPKDRQPFFTSEGGNDQPLDQVGWVYDQDRSERMACIIEVKAMRANDWIDWRYHRTWHKEKDMQHAKHVQTAKKHGLGGVCVVAVNKDSSEYFVWCYDVMVEQSRQGWDYEH